MIEQSDTCFGCYWEMNCSENLKCEDFTPYESDDTSFYDSVLRENIEEYETIIEEF